MNQKGAQSNSGGKHQVRSSGCQRVKSNQRGAVTQNGMEAGDIHTIMTTSRARNSRAYKCRLEDDAQYRNCTRRYLKAMSIWELDIRFRMTAAIRTCARSPPKRTRERISRIKRHHQNAGREHRTPPVSHSVLPREESGAGRKPLESFWGVFGRASARNGARTRGKPVSRRCGPSKCLISLQVKFVLGDEEASRI